MRRYDHAVPHKDSRICSSRMGTPGSSVTHLRHSLSMSEKAANGSAARLATNACAALETRSISRDVLCSL